MWCLWQKHYIIVPWRNRRFSQSQAWVQLDHLGSIGCQLLCDMRCRQKSSNWAYCAEKNLNKLAFVYFSLFEEIWAGLTILSKLLTPKTDPYVHKLWQKFSLISYLALLIFKKKGESPETRRFSAKEMCFLSVMKSFTLQVPFTQNFHCFGRGITTISWLTSLQEREFSYFIPQMLELVILY